MEFWQEQEPVIVEFANHQVVWVQSEARDFLTGVDHFKDLLRLGWVILVTAFALTNSPMMQCKGQVWLLSSWLSA